MSGEREDLELPVIADGKSRTYPVDFSKLKVKPKRTARFYCYFFPDPMGNCRRANWNSNRSGCFCPLRARSGITVKTRNSASNFWPTSSPALRKMRLLPPRAEEQFAALRKKFATLTRSGRSGCGKNRGLQATEPGVRSAEPETGRRTPGGRTAPGTRGAGKHAPFPAGTGRNRSG